MKHFAKILAAVTALLIAAGPVSAYAARLPDDTYFPDQWYLKHIRAHEAWDSSLGFEGIAIAIIDSGVDIGHPDLKDNIWRNVNEVAGDGIDNDGNGYVDDVNGWDFVSNDNDPRPDVSGDFSVLGANHGTIDAGIAAAKGNNGRGITGVSWQSAIMPIRTLDSNGIGDPQNVVRAVEYAVRNGAKIINLSFAGPSLSEELAIALRRAYDSGVFVVAAAGNAPDDGEAVDLDARPLYPVCLDRDSSENFVYGVVATDENDRRAAFSNYGASCADISAPGTRMLSTQYFVPGSKQFGSAYGGYFNGTSLAAAEVSGVVAILRALDYNLTPKQIMNILTDSSVKIDAVNPGFFGKLGRGRIDVAAAVERVLAYKKPGPAMVSTASLLPPDAGSRLVVAAPGPGRKPEVRLFTADGMFVRSFSAFPDSFLGGVSLATANFDNTTRKSVVAGAMSGGAPHVRIFDINTRPLGGFFAYDERFRGGVSVAAADLDGDGRAEIVTMAPGKNPVKVWNGKGQLLASFAPSAEPKSVTFSDVDGDGKNEIVLRTAGKTAVVATAYRANGDRVGEFDAETFMPAALAVNGASRLSPKGLIFGSLRGGAPSVALPSGISFTAFESSFKGGVTAVIAE